MKPAILIVDDEAAVREYLAGILAAGYEVFTAATGMEALEMIQGQDYDLVICDLMMPDLDGLEIIARARQYRPDTAFIVLTAYGSLESAIKAIRLGASDYLLKPFDPEELLVHVKNAVEKRLLRSEYEARTRELHSFVTAVSHDLAGHLVSLRGFTRRLRERFWEGIAEEARSCLEHIESSAERMERLVTAITEYAKAGSTLGQVEFVDLNEVISEVLESFGDLIQEQHVVVEVSPDMPVIEAEWIDAYRIFHNLVGNALKYTRPDVQPRVEVGMKERPGHYQFYVRDNGIGIRSEERERIFEMFGRGSGHAIPGTGLGLAIVRRILDRVGGRIWVESKDQEGATFYFTLPKREAKPGPREPAAATRAKADSR